MRILLTLAVLTAVQDPIDRPAPTLQPEIPEGRARMDDRIPPPGSIDRDGWVADRFTAEGQTTSYAFDSEAGELSLFDLGAWGYSRGWAMTVAMRVVGPDGGVLVERERRGGTTARVYQSFVAPRAGRYAVELEARASFYRFTLVRHSSYAPRERGATLDLGGKDQAHGYLADARDARTFRLPVKAGEPLAVRVRPTHPGAHTIAFQARRAAPMKVVLRKPLIPPPRGWDGSISTARPTDGETVTRRTLRHAQGMAFPVLAHRITGPDGALLSADAQYHMWTPREDGDVEVTVYAGEGDDGALFVVGVERGLELVPVHGRVGDADDEPLAGVRVHFVHQEAIEHVASATTAADGTWSAEVVPGSYAMLYERPGDSVETVYLKVAPGFVDAINTIYPH